MKIFDLADEPAAVKATARGYMREKLTEFSMKTLILSEYGLCGMNFAPRIGKE